MLHQSRKIPAGIRKMSCKRRQTLFQSALHCTLQNGKIPVGRNASRNITSKFTDTCKGTVIWKMRRLTFFSESPLATPPGDASLFLQALPHAPASVPLLQTRATT